MKILKFLGFCALYFICKVLPILLVLTVLGYVTVQGFAYGDVSGIFAIKDIIANGLF